MTPTELRNAIKIIEDKLSKLDSQKDLDMELQELRAKHAARQKAFWPLNKAHDLQLIELNIDRVEKKLAEVSGLYRAKSELWEQLGECGEALQKRKYQLFIDFLQKSTPHVEGEVERYVEYVLIESLSIKRRIQDFHGSSVQRPRHSPQPVSTEQALDFEVGIINRFLKLFPHIRLEDGWRLSYIFEMTNGADLNSFKFFLTDNRASVCPNVFEHVIISDNSKEAIIDAILFDIAIGNIESSGPITKLVFDLNVACIDAVREICKEFDWYNVVSDAAHEASFVQELKSLETTFASADIEFRIVQESKNKYSIHYITFVKDNVSIPRCEDRNRYTCCENTAIISVGECIGVMNVKSKTIFEEWGKRTIVW